MLAAAAVVHLTINLLASSEVPPKDSNWHGSLSGRYDTTSKVLQWKVKYADLTGPARMAHFHGPAPIGKDAPIVIPIETNKLPSPITGSQTLTDAQASQLLDGQWYFNVHMQKIWAARFEGR